MKNHKENHTAQATRTETLRQMLLERRQEVMKEIDDLLTQRRKEQALLREESVPDAGDSSLQDAVGDRQISILEVRDRMRQQLDEALVRLDEGRYGVCVDCGTPISEDRLKAVPFAQRCKACQEQAESIEEIEKAPDRRQI